MNTILANLCTNQATRDNNKRKMQIETKITLEFVAKLDIKESKVNISHKISKTAFGTVDQIVKRSCFKIKSIYQKIGFFVQCLMYMGHIYSTTSTKYKHLFLVAISCHLQPFKMIYVR